MWTKRGVYVSSLLFISFINYLKNDCYIVQSLIFLILHNMATSCNMRVINNNYNENEIFSDYILMQETSIFNKTAIQYYFENNAIECSYGFRAVRTEKELYVKLSSGKKYYYLLPDEETDCIGHADQERLKCLDRLAGDTFEDLSIYDEEIESFRKQFETHE